MFIIFFRTKEKHDAPPSNAGIQNVPKSLKEFMKLKELGAAQSSEKVKKVKKQSQKENISDQINKNRNQVPNLIESTNNTVDDNSRTNSIIHDPNELKLPRSIKQKRKQKLLKLKLKRKLKKDQKKAEVDEDEAAIPEFVKEDIKFGETADRPPQFSVLPRKASKVDYANRVRIKIPK